MYASRWIMAPIYLGLSLVLLGLGIKFFQEIFHILPIIFEMTEVDLVLVTLSLIDITLVGGLNYLADNHPVRLDLTRYGKFTDHTIDFGPATAGSPAPAAACRSLSRSPIRKEPASSMPQSLLSFRIMPGPGLRKSEARR